MVYNAKASKKYPAWPEAAWAGNDEFVCTEGQVISFTETRFFFRTGDAHW